MPLKTPQQVLEIITSIAVREPVKTPMWLWDAAGHVLAQDVTTARDIPPFNRAAMDGYALRSTDVDNVPVTLDVIAVREAGDTSPVSIAPGQCVKIMTGAALPDDADAVVMIEKTKSHNPAKKTTILEPVKPFTDIARQGEDAPAGSIVLHKGQLLTGPSLSVAAGVGQTMLEVYQHPLVSLLQTGGELVEPGDNATGNKIYNSNATLLTGLINDTRISRSRYLGILKDDLSALANAIHTGLTGDVLILTGGVSKGDFDYVPEVLQDCGVTIHIHGAAIKPGKPLLFGGTSDGRFVFGLPGNPVSVMICFYEFVLPFLRRLNGMSGSPAPAGTNAVLTAPIHKKTGRQFYCSAYLFYRSNQLFAHPISGHGSGDYVSSACANGVAIIPADSTAIAAGQEVLVHPWQVPMQESEEPK